MLLSTARSLLFAAGPAALLCAAAPTAQALTISAANVNPPVSADAATKDVIYYLDLHAGPQDERFSIALEPPPFATKGGRDEGQAIDGPRQFTLLGGPGTVGQVITEPSIGQVCSDRDDAFHGYTTGSSTVDLHLPAGANTTLAVRYATGRRAPWSDTDLRLRFRIQQQLFGTYPGTSPLFGAATAVDAAQTITRTPPVAIGSTGGSSKIGAHLMLKTTPAGTWGDIDQPRKVQAGGTVRVSGQVLGAARGKRVQLQWRKGTGTLRVAATARTASAGRFATTLRVPGRGTYELWARYPSQSGPLKADTTSCPLRYRAS